MKKIDFENLISAHQVRTPIKCKEIPCNIQKWQNCHISDDYTRNQPTTKRSGRRSRL